MNLAAARAVADAFVAMLALGHLLGLSIGNAEIADRHHTAIYTALSHVGTLFLTTERAEAVDAALELTETVAIIVLASAAEDITAGSAGSEAILFATHLLASGADLQPWAIRAKPTGIIAAIHPLTVRLLAANTARNDLAPLAGVNGQLVQVPVVIVAVNTICNVTHAAYCHSLLRICLKAIHAGSHFFFVAD